MVTLAVPSRRRLASVALLTVLVLLLLTPAVDAKKRRKRRRGNKFFTFMKIWLFFAGLAITIPLCIVSAAGFAACAVNVRLCVCCFVRACAAGRWEATAPRCENLPPTPMLASLSPL